MCTSRKESFSKVSGKIEFLRESQIGLAILSRMGIRIKQSSILLIKLPSVSPRRRRREGWFGVRRDEMASGQTHPHKQHTAFLPSCLPPTGGGGGGGWREGGSRRLQTSEGPAEQLSSLPSRRWRGGGGGGEEDGTSARRAHTHEGIGR